MKYWPPSAESSRGWPNARGADARTSALLFGQGSIFARRSRAERSATRAFPATQPCLDCHSTPRGHPLDDNAQDDRQPVEPHEVAAENQQQLKPDGEEAAGLSAGSGRSRSPAHRTTAEAQHVRTDRTTLPAGQRHGVRATNDSSRSVFRTVDRRKGGLLCSAPD